MKNIKVVAAIIVDGDKIFATQRGYGEFKDKWEFPGGKIENGETPKQAIIREIKEELDTIINVDGLLDTVEYDYPNFHLSMDCFWCKIKEGKLVLKEHEDAKWLAKNELNSVDWLPADKTIIKKIEKKLYRSYIEFKDISKTYQMGEVEINALNEASFEIEKGELVCILGPSGAGKTTTLNILGGMDNATSGEVIIDGKNITNLKGKKLIQYRRNDIGFVFQFYNLIQNLTALENVEIAVQLCKDYLEPGKILEKVGLENRKDNFPSQLSGGEQQRVAIARAIAKNPKLLLCDEPTGALDYKTGKQILKLLQDTCKNEKMTVIIVTHNGAIAEMADKIIKFKNGTVEDIIINKNPKSAEEIEW